MRILLTHTPHMRDNYYGSRALAGLRALGDVTLHEGADVLAGAALIEAGRGMDFIVADRMTALPGVMFESLPDLRCALRVAVDIRNIDVAAAPSAGRWHLWRRRSACIFW